MCKMHEDANKWVNAAEAEVGDLTQGLQDAE